MNLNSATATTTWLRSIAASASAATNMPEAEILMPDPAFIAERRKTLVGLLITHAHEDHIGAVPHLWPQLRCPVYATPFAAAVLRRKLGEARLLGQVQLHVIPPAGRFELGPFRCSSCR